MIESAPVFSGLSGLSLEQEGLSDFLNSSDPWEKYIVKSQEYAIGIMHAGNNMVGNISQFRIKELLESAKDEYDFICIDCAPVLQSDLTEHVALYSDIVVLIALGDSTLFPDLRKAAELLVHLKVPAIAPLLNWGGVIRSISIDKLLEKQPEILDKINTKKIEEFIQKLPPTKELISNIKTFVFNTLKKGKRSSKGEKRK